MSESDAKAPAETASQALLGVLFASLDANNDGKLDSSEVKAWVARDPLFKDGDRAAEAKKIMDTLDSNHDNTISKDEFVSGMSHMSSAQLEGLAVGLVKRAVQESATDAAKRKSLCSQLFMQCDRDKSGTVSREELIAWMKRDSYFKRIPSVAFAVVQALEESKSHELSLDQFSQFWSRFTVSELSGLAVDLIGCRKKHGAKAAATAAAPASTSTPTPTEEKKVEKKYVPLTAPAHVAHVPDQGVDVVLRTVFKGLDKNGDGKLDKAEVKAWISSDVLFKHGDLAKTTDAIFAALDVNHDNVISEAEFVSGMSKLSARDIEALAVGLVKRANDESKTDKEKRLALTSAAFMNCDLNEDGIVDRSELLAWVRRDSYFKRIPNSAAVVIKALEETAHHSLTHDQFADIFGLFTVQELDGLAADLVGCRLKHGKKKPAAPAAASAAPASAEAKK